MLVENKCENKDTKIIEKIKNIKMLPKKDDEKTIIKIGENQFLLFNDGYIKDYKKINDKDERKFLNEVNKTKPARNSGQNGIKPLYGIKFNVSIDDKKQAIDKVYELKINGNNRILLFETKLSIENLTVTLLVASHYVGGEIHNDEVKSKTYTANDLLLQNNHKEIEILKNFGFFNTKEKAKSARTAAFFQKYEPELAGDSPTI